MATETVPVNFEQTNESLLKLEALMEGIKGLSPHSNEAYLAQIANELISKLAIALNDSSDAALVEANHG